MQEHREAELDEIAEDLYQKPYGELTEYEQGNVQVTFEAEDARQSEAVNQADIKRDREIYGDEQTGEVSPAQTKLPSNEWPAVPVQQAAGKLAGPVRSAAARAEAKGQREQLAQEVFRRPYANLFEDGQAHVREE